MSPLPVYHLQSLRIILPAILLVFAAVTGGASYLAMWQLNRDQYEAEAMEDAFTRTTELQSRIETWMQRRDPQMVQLALSAQTLRIETSVALLLDETGTVVAASRRELTGRPLEITALGLARPDAAALQDTMRRVRENRRGEHLFTADRNTLLTCYPSAQPLQRGELAVRRSGMIVTTYDLRFARAAAQRRLQAEFGILAAGILALALGLGVCLHFMVTRRVDRLYAAMQHFAAGRTVEQMKPRMNDEIAQLKREFNEMARTIGHEMAERRLAEASLREHEAKLSLAMTMARLVAWEYDVLQTRFTFDDDFFRLLRTTAEREGGRFMSLAEYARRFFPAEGSGLVVREIEQAIATTDPEYSRRLEHPFVRADGTTGVFLVQLKVAKDATGRTVKIHGVNQDITERVQAERQRGELERQLRQIQKMDALGVLAGGIAHDFNNILTGIISFTELCRMDVGPNAEVQANLNEVLRAARRATQLVQQILAFSRRTPQERKIAAAAPLVCEALKLLRSTLPSTIQFEEHIEPDLPPVRVDATQIHQVVMNLCTNAGHAMYGSQGRLQVRLESCGITAQNARFGLELPPGRYLRLIVADTGSGMSEATLQRLFEPFFTTKGPGEGTGLGLAVVHSIVKSHDGAITVDSRPGHGSTFSVYLPVAADEKSKEGATEPDAPRGRGERVLFVDDEAVICAAVARLLERQGYRPLVFSDSAAAWRAFAAAPADFDVMVTDLTMPELTGVDLAGKVRELRPEFPVILTSGFSGALKHESLHLIGVRELVQKPIDFRALGRAIHRALHEVSPG